MHPQLSQDQLAAIDVHPSLQHLNIPVKQWMTENPNYVLAASALVFHGDHILLIQRAPTDDWPLFWEPPGGACEPNETIMEATARELFEESGLIARSIKALLSELELLEETPKDNVPPKFKMFSFLVELEAEESGNVKTMVKLDPEEHCAFVWATEEDVRIGRCGEVLLRFTREEVKDIIFKGFEAMKIERRISEQ